MELLVWAVVGTVLLQLFHKLVLSPCQYLPSGVWSGPTHEGGEGDLETSSFSPLWFWGISLLFHLESGLLLPGDGVPSQLSGDNLGPCVFAWALDSHAPMMSK